MFLFESETLSLFENRIPPWVRKQHVVVVVVVVQKQAVVPHMQHMLHVPRAHAVPGQHRQTPAHASKMRHSGSFSLVRQRKGRPAARAGAKPKAKAKAKPKAKAKVQAACEAQASEEVRQQSFCAEAVAVERQGDRVVTVLTLTPEMLKKLGHAQVQQKGDHFLFQNC